jgi:hypothetical protein
MKFKILIIFIFILIGISSKSFSQCPTNLQFELGNFTNWQLDSGKTCSMTGSLFPPYVNLQWNTQPHHLISDITPISYYNFSGLDSLGGFPLVCPFSNDPFSVRISSYPIYYKHTYIPNNITNSISYRLHVPLNSSSYSLTYYYAIIFQDPLHYKQ